LANDTPGEYFNGLRYDRFSAGDRAYLLVFMLAGVLAFEIVTMSLTMTRDEILGVDLLSIVPTVAIIRWRNALKAMPLCSTGGGTRLSDAARVAFYHKELLRGFLPLLAEAARSAKPVAPPAP
jgi:uncharacterized membrane protein